MHLASEDIEAKLAPVRCESGTRTPSTRSQKSTSSTSAKESIPAWDSGLFSSNSTPSATKLVRANSQSFAAMIFGSVSGIINSPKYEAARKGVKHGDARHYLLARTAAANHALPDVRTCSSAARAN